MYCRSLTISSANSSVFSCLGLRSSQNGPHPPDHRCHQPVDTIAAHRNHPASYLRLGWGCYLSRAVIFHHYCCDRKAFDSLRTEACVDALDWRLVVFISGIVGGAWDLSAACNRLTARLDEANCSRRCSRRDLSLNMS